MVELTSSEQKQLATYKNRLARVKRGELWASDGATHSRGESRRDRSSQSAHRSVGGTPSSLVVRVVMPLWPSAEIIPLSVNESPACAE